MSTEELLRKLRSEIISNRGVFTYDNLEYKKGYERCCDDIL